MRHRAGRAIFLRGCFLIGATFLGASMQPSTVPSAAASSALPTSAEILANEARGNQVPGPNQSRSDPPAQTVSSAGRGVTDWLANAASAVSDAIAAAASQNSRKSKMARPATAETGSKRSPERNDVDKVDAEYVQNIVSSGLCAAMKSWVRPPTRDSASLKVTWQR